MQRKQLVYILAIVALLVAALPAAAVAAPSASPLLQGDSPDTLIEQAKALDAEQNPAAPEAAPQYFPTGGGYPLFVGVDDTTVPAYRVDVVTNGFQQAFVGFQVWGSAYDPVNDKVYFNNGSTLYEWPVGGAVATLGTITDPAGATQSMTGLAFYNGVLYGVKNIANEAIWAIDTTTRIATVHIDYVDADFDLGGFSADPNTGEFYATNDDTSPNGSGLFRINPDGTGTLITPYPAGETDIDGLAVSDDGFAYLVIDQPGNIYVWDFGAGAYAAPLTAPWTTSEVFSGGAWIPQPEEGGTLTCNGATVGFENGSFPADWSITTLALPGGEWVVSMDNSSAFWNPGPAPEGVYYASANDDLPGSGSDGSADFLYTNIIDLSGYTSASLDFWYHFNGAFGHVAGGVEVSGDGGTTWDGELILPVGADWQTYSLDLSAYAGNNNVQVRFHSNDGGFWAAGYAIDGVALICGQVAEPPNIFVDPLSMASTQPPDVQVQQTLTISNTGGGTLNWTIDEEPASPVQNPDGGQAPNAPAAGATGSRGGAAGGAAPMVYDSPADFSEDFADITLLPGQGWAFQNNSAPLGLTDWFQGNDTVFPAHAGAPTAYIGANFNNTSGVGTISNWMMTPEISLADGDTISFWTSTAAGSIWPDRLEMRLSAAGASTNVGTLATDVGDFTTLLLSVNPTLAAGGYPETWTQYTATLSGIPGGATGRIAWRYFVTDGGPSGNNSNYIGIDTVEFTSGGGGGDACTALANVPWLSEVPANGSNGGGTATDVTVTFDSTGLAAGVYNATLCVSSNDPDPGPGNETDLVVVPVTLTVETPPEPPNIFVDPLSMASSQPANVQVNQTLVISNTGGGTLDWTIDEEDTTLPDIGPVTFAPQPAAEVVGAPEAAAPEAAPAKVAEWRAPAAVLYDNGGMVTHPGGGFGGADASSLQTAIGLNVYGFGHAVTSGFRLADDFTVPAGGWNVDSITFFAYQTGSTTASTINAVNLRIWDGPPGQGGSNIVFGDTTTNRLSSTSFTNIYRSIDTGLLANNRPIMADVAAVGTFLPAGTYWVDWQTGGTLASGPWAPPVTILGQVGKPGSNAVQFDGAAWTALIDTGTALAPQDLPFIVEGTSGGGGEPCVALSDIAWLTLAPAAGSNAGGTDTDVTVTFDSTGLVPGVYTGNLCVDSNDPDAGPGNETELVIVPVTLTVLPPTAVALTGLAAGTAQSPAPLAGLPLAALPAAVAAALGAAFIWRRQRD